MDIEFDGSHTSKIVRDEDMNSYTNDKSKTINVDSDGREDVPNPPKRKNVKQSMVWDHFERLKGDPKDPCSKSKYCELPIHVILNVMVVEL